MKKITFAILTALSFATAANAQVAIYDDIDLGTTSGNLQTISSPGPWGVTHGTPSYSPTQIWMWANNPGSVGEGVYRVVNLQESANFEVSIGISNFTNPLPNPETFKVVLANDPLPANCSSSGCPIPTFSSSRVLYTYSGATFNNNQLILRFATAPGESWKYLIIYPQQYTNSSSSINMTITCLTIYSCSNGDKTICSGQIPASANFYRNYYIGSNYCSLSPFVTSNPNVNTDLTGTETVTVGPNTDISVANANSFVMEITPCISPIGLAPTDGSVNATLVPQTYLCSASRPAQSTPEGIPAIETPEEITIYPNPTSSQFKISLPASVTDAEIQLSGMDGRLLKQTSMTGGTMDISLENYPAGTYILRINTKSGIVVKKVIKL